MTANSREHWEKIWAASDPQRVTWYQDSPKICLRLIEATGLGPEARVLDVGCGASTLVDCLLGRGFEMVSAIDLSRAAIEHSRARLGDRSDRVRWMTGDATTMDFEEPFDLWHDRAVLHFLTDGDARESYAASLFRSLVPNGHAVISTFAPDGPTTCSGLEVVRYGPQEITALLGESFQLLETEYETHISPRGNQQKFAYFRLQRRT